MTKWPLWHPHEVCGAAAAFYVLIGKRKYGYEETDENNKTIEDYIDFLCRV